MSCTYNYQGKLNLSYKQLAESLEDDLSNVNDLLYSLDSNKQQRTLDKIDEIKESNKRRGTSLFTSLFKQELISESDILNGSAELKVGDSDFSGLSFIDSNLFVDKNGNPLMPPLKVDDFLKSMEAIYNKTLSPDEVKLRLNVIKSNWKRIAKDCRDFHKIISYTYPETSSKALLEKLNGTSFETLGGLIKTNGANSVYDKIIHEVFKTNGKYSKELGDDSLIFTRKNITLSAKLSGRDSNIYAHIDFLAVKPDGTVEVFLIKGSHEPSAFWDLAKKEKYRYELALIARLLLYNGIDASNIRLNIVPVVFKYDNNFQNITDIAVQPVECYSHRESAFVMLNEFKQVSRFIESKVELVVIESAVIDEVDRLLKAFIPEGNIKAKGITASVKKYIKNNWKYWIQCEQPESGYNLNIDGEIYHINDTTKGEDNEEVIELIKNLQNNVNGDDFGVMNAQSIVSTLKQNRRVGFAAFGNPNLELFFEPYFEHTVLNIDGKDYYSYKWEIIESEDILNCNVIIFKNKDTHLMDIIDISSLDPDLKVLLNGRQNILGYHLTDMQATDFDGRELLKSTYGHIEIMRSLFLLNTLLPQLDSQVKLGNVSVIGGVGKQIKSITYPIELVLGNFTKAVQVLNKTDSSMDIKNNLSNAEKISSIDLLIDSYWSIILESPALSSGDLITIKELMVGSDEDNMQHLIDGSVIDSLTTAQSNEVKIARLTELIDKLNSIFKAKFPNYATDPDSLIKYANSNTKSLLRACSKLLIEASIALDRMTGNIRILDHELKTIDKFIARPLDMANALVRLISKLLTDAIHSTASKLDSEVSDFVQITLDFYKIRNYTKFENYVLGSLGRVFDRFYQDLDDELIFKNPWDLKSDLNDDEREYLKKVILIINKVRFGEEKLAGVTDMKDFIQKNPNFLFVPLMRASDNTKNLNKWRDPKKYASELVGRVREYCKDPMTYFRQSYENIVSEDQKAHIDADMRDLQAYNPFKASETKEGRERLLRKGKTFFETNIEEIVIDYLHRHIQEQEMNKMLVKTKGILLYLKLQGIHSGDKDKYNDVIERIDEYITTSVYNKSIIKEDMKKIASVVKPLRQLVTASYIALNPIAAVRDVVGGALSNIVRSMTGFRTDIDVKDVTWAYYFVLRNGSMSTMTIDLLSKFNSKYLISNINLESLQEGYKTGRQGLLGSNWKYWTLKKPDFLNRMVLFIAKLKHDGSVDAYSVKDGMLHYNWRLDKRFNLLAENNKTNLEAYEKQASLYLSLIVAWNKENPDKQLPVNLSTDLPDGYTLNQVETIKHLGDSIYGAYSTSQKAGYELLFLGLLFVVFSTWMNGIWDVYFGKRRESSFETQKIQKRDPVTGELLYFDENGEITTTPTNRPYLEDIPLIVQGVMYTLLDIGQILLFRDNKIQAFKEEIWGNSIQKRNLKRLFTDLIMWLILSQLFKQVFDPAYKEHKKNAPGDAIVTNVLTEWLYKAGGSCFEEFRGPFPILDYVINNTKPAAFLWSQKFIQDTYNMAFGDKTIPLYIIGMQALPRSMQDTYRMYKRDLKKVQEAQTEE